MSSSLLSMSIRFMATVTISVPEARIACSITSLELNFPVPRKRRELNSRRNADKAGNSHLGVPATSKEESDRRHEEILKAGLPAQDLADLIRQLSEQMHTAAEQLQFELAARLRDEIRDLKKELRQMTEASK